MPRPPRKALSEPGGAHAIDRAAVRSILDEARDEELIRLAHSPDPLPPPAVVRKLAAVTVQELDGSEITLGSLWQDRPAAVVWLRHYG